MSMKELSDKISEIYDIELAGEMTAIFRKIVDEQKDLEKTVEIYRDYAEYARKKCNELETGGGQLNFHDVGKKMYHDALDELKKTRKELEQAEYDRDYYEKCLRE